MQTRQIDIAAFVPEHLDAAVALSRQVGWPHRHEDGLSLYKKLGLRETGRLLQQQGITARIAAPAITSAATSAAALKPPIAHADSVPTIFAPANQALG